LADITLDIPEGSFVGIVGPSGSGKSTLCKLLLGSDVVRSGSIAFNGVDIRDIYLPDLRRHVGVVAQHGAFFSGTLRANLDVTGSFDDEAVWRAVGLAAFDQEVKLMPMGLDTFIGDGGVGLSGGQKQRLLIGRALLANPAIAIFDEATSSLDVETQSKIVANVEGLSITRIFVTHRFETIKNADIIIVLEHGRIVQMGKYQDLLSVDGLFRHLVRRQEYSEMRTIEMMESNTK
jgi:ABC-type bacteriocin/lantibiotic exporter with double-glycine peptidase domain